MQSQEAAHSPTMATVRAMLRGLDPWIAGTAAVVSIALIAGAIVTWLSDDDQIFLFAVLALGAVGLVCAIRGNSLGALIAVVLAAIEVQDPAPPATWTVAGGLLLLFSLQRPRLDAVLAGTAFAVTGVPIETPWSTGGLDGGAFGIYTLAAAMVGIGQWVQAQRKYVVAEVGRRHEETERRRVQVVQHVAEERLKIARDLHDSVAHHIAVVNVQTNLARASLTVSIEAADRALESVQTAARDVLSELQQVLSVLRDQPGDSATRTQQDLEPGLAKDRVLELVQRYTEIGLRVDHTGLDLLSELPPATQTALYRVTQEALTNAHRYGDGAVTVHLSLPYDELALTVRNRIDPAPQDRVPSGGGGHGLTGMAERVDSLDGRMSAQREDHDFVVRVRLPFASAAQ
jgi:signal transduction histidine kinase